MREGSLIKKSRKEIPYITFLVLKIHTLCFCKTRALLFPFTHEREQII